ncbi:MAG: glycoside hydrolase family 3 C-terminal domain-containing protein [Treponema sp.]|jgi:beta-glucosidase|nr:glycoside hydrolase family 3 C-terminal domain-containing protein [Treponema sp.]
MFFQYPFLDPGLPLKERIRDLISRLTVEEKAGFIPSRNQAVERLGIAAWAIGAEGAHGFVDREGQNTTFPQTIGLASGWDRELLRKIGEVSAVEARVFCATHERRGGLALWSPTIDLERDPRWGRTEEGYGEDPFLTSELSSSYIRGAQGDDPFYLRVSCGPKHFFANNNERLRASCSCSIPPRLMHEYYLAPFRSAIQKAKAVSLMTSYNEVNGIPMILHPMLNDKVKNQWGLEGHIVTDGNDFLQTVNAHHYFDTHAETLAAALQNGADTMTDDAAEVIPAVMEALKRNLLDEAELDKHLERILAIRFRLGLFDPPGHCPYDLIGEADSMKDEYRSLAREAVRKSAVLLKNEGNFLPLRPQAVKGSIAVMGPLADELHLDWYSGHPPYMSTPLEGLRELYGQDRVVYTDCRDIVSFATEDGRPLVLTDTPAEKVLAVGAVGDKPCRFYREDWGWGVWTFADVESGLLLENPYYRPEPGTDADRSQLIIKASAKSSLIWFNKTLFNVIPRENSLCLLRIYDNRRVSYPREKGPVELRDDTFDGPNELFRMKVERDGLAAAAEAAATAGQVIFIGGNDPMINGREDVDRPSLNLPPRQEELIRRVCGLNPRTVLVLISGYPFTCGDIITPIPAVLWMAHGIQETGHGLADVLGGAYSPAGRLPLTWYEDEQQLPSIMEYDIVSAASTYQYFPGKALFPFGYGLSYSSFAYSDLSIDQTAAKEDETVAVSFRLKNTGSVAADEVPQMYVTVSGSLFRRPLKSLKGFTRLSLKPGEEQTVRFNLPVQELAVWDSHHNRFCVEAGYCAVMVGASSADIRLSGGFEVRGESLFPRKLSGQIYAQTFDEYSNCFLHEKRGSAVPAVFNKDNMGLYNKNIYPGVTQNFTEEKIISVQKLRDTPWLNSCSLDSGGWIRFAALDFAGGFNCLSAVVQGGPHSRIELRLDAPDGALAGTIAVPNTGDISFYAQVKPYSPRCRPLWACVETVTETICGVHDLYMVLYGKTGIWHFEWRKI